MNNIIINNISFEYEGRQIFKNLSCEIKKHELTHITGVSGSGKTTLVNLLLQLRNPLTGNIAGTENMKKSSVFQEDRLCENLNAFTNIKFITQKSNAEIENALKDVGLEGFYYTPVKKLRVE